MRLFADTSALLSVSVAGDRSHDAATVVWDGLAREQPLLITTNYVVVELHAALRKRFGMDAVRGFAHRIQPVLEVHWVDEPTHQRGVAMFLGASRQGPSLVDCVSFEVMRELGITCAFALDPHFAEQGFEVIPKAPPDA